MEKMRNIFENIRIISKSFVFLQQNCYLHISIFKYYGKIH